MLNKKVVIIRSANRDTGTAENFTITDSGDVFTNVPTSVRLSSAIIPYTWANVGPAFGNTVDFTGTVSGAHTIVIATNNYSGTTLATALQTQMSAAAAPDVYTVTFDSVTNKFTISSTETFTIDFTQPNNMHVILGFPEAVTPLSNTITSTSVAGFVVDKGVLICSNLINGIDNGMINWVSGPPPNSQTLAYMPIVGPWSGIIDFVNPFDVPSFIITNSDFSLEPRTTPRALQFWLQFPSGTQVDLQGQDWECVIVFGFD